MKITGEMLKNERINKNLSLQDVAVSLKLNSKIVGAIESGNLDALPAKTFVRGFVKSYAQFLKLDPDVVLRQFQEEMGTTSPLPKVPPPKPNEVKPVKTSVRSSLQSTDAKNYLANEVIAPEGSKNIFLMVGIAFALVVVLIVSNKIIDSFKENPVAIENTPTSSEAVAELTAENTPAPATVSGDQTSIADDSAKKPEESKQQATAVAAAAPSNTEEVFPPSSGAPVELVLEAKKDTEIFYAKGNTREFHPLKLATNQIQVLRSKVGLHIKASDGSAFKINVNGIDKGNAGPANSAVKLSF